MVNTKMIKEHREAAEKEKFERCLKLLENLTLAAERHDSTEIEAAGGAARQFLDNLRHEE